MISAGGYIAVELIPAVSALQVQAAHLEEDDHTVHAAIIRIDDRLTSIQDSLRVIDVRIARIDERTQRNGR